MWLLLLLPALGATRVEMLAGKVRDASPSVEGWACWSAEGGGGGEAEGKNG